MKVRVDSGELSRAVAIAAKWSSSSLSDITKCIGLWAEGHALFVRSTMLHAHCLVRVNAFDVEPGDAVVMAKHLEAATHDTGGDVTLRTTKARLVLEDEYSTIRIGRRDESIDDFPAWRDCGEGWMVPKDQLLAVCSSTKTEGETGLVFLSALHMIPTDTATLIMGVDGIVGTLSEIDAVFPYPFAMDARLIKSALSGFDGSVSLAVDENSVELSAPGSPVKVSFSRTVTPEKLFGLVDTLFHGRTYDDDLGLTSDALAALTDLCKRATRIDEDAELAIFSEGEMPLSVTIAGDGIGIESSVACDGSLRRAVMYCKTLLQCLAPARSSDVFEILTMPSPAAEGDRVGRVKIIGSDIHVIGCSASGRLGQ